MTNSNISIKYNNRLDPEIQYSPLKIKFWVIENTLILQVLEQDERLCIDGFVFTVSVTNDDNSYDFYIASIDNPEIEEDRLYIRGGEKSKDYITNAMSFVSKEQALDYVELIKIIFSAIPFMETEIIVDIIQ